MGQGAPRKGDGSPHRRSQAFAQSAGRLAKNDAIDADTIAWFAETFGEAPGQAYDAEREKLLQIVNARRALLETETMLANQGEHSVPDVVRTRQERLLQEVPLDDV